MNEDVRVEERDNGMEDRRHEERREHCDVHLLNTATLHDCASSISAVRSSLSTGRWIFGVIVGVFVIIIGSTLAEISSAIKEIRTDIKIMLPVEVRIERLEKTVDYNSDRIRTLEKDSHDH